MGIPKGKETSTTLPNSVLIALIGILALVVRTPGIFWGYDLLYGNSFAFFHWDEYLFVQQVIAYLQNGKILRENYVLGFGAEVCTLLKILSAFVELTPELIIVATRTMNVLFGAATAVLTYFLAGQLFARRDIATLSALLVALAPLHVMHSHYATPVVSMTFWCYLSFYLSIRAQRENAERLWIGACSAAGIAIAVKFGLMTLIPLLYVGRSFTARQRMLGLVTLALSFLVFNYWQFSFRFLSKVGEAFVFDNMLERSYNHLLNPLTYSIALAAGIGALPTLLFVCGVGRGRERDSERLRSFCLTIPLLVYALVICSFSSCFPRHVIVFIPSIACFAAHGFFKIFARQNIRRKAAMSFLILYQIVAVSWFEQRFLFEQRFEAKSWLASEAKTDTVWLAGRVTPSFVAQFPEATIVKSPDRATLVFLDETIKLLLGRSLLTPFNSNPRPEEVYHWESIAEPEFLKKLIAGDAGFEERARFATREILPEYILFKALIGSFAYEVGDVVIYGRR